MQAHNDYCYMVFSIPARGLIGLRTRLLNATQGTAVIHHRFELLQAAGGRDPDPPTGVLVSLVGGRAVAYARSTRSRTGPSRTSATTTWSTRA